MLTVWIRVDSSGQLHCLVEKWLDASNLQLSPQGLQYVSMWVKVSSFLRQYWHCSGSQKVASEVLIVKNV